MASNKGFRQKHIDTILSDSPIEDCRSHFISWSQLLVLFQEAQLQLQGGSVYEALRNYITKSATKSCNVELQLFCSKLV